MITMFKFDLKIALQLKCNLRKTKSIKNRRDFYDTLN